MGTEDETLVERQGLDSEGKRLVLLVMISGGVREYDLEPEVEYTIGRSASSEIYVDAASVSRAHALLVCREDHVLLRDLGSTNGTMVNGEKVGESPAQVHVGDAIRIGDLLAQLRPSRASRHFAPRFVDPGELDARLAEEAERCVRYDRTLAAITLETLERDATTERSERAREVVAGSLRTLDYAAVRKPGRIDMLLLECPREDAREAAERLHARLGKEGIEAKLGVAVYPGDVASADSLLLGAQLAMHSQEEGVGQAHEGVRMMRIGSREIVVADEAMIRLFGLAERVAASPMSVLVQGETGAGKEVVAEAVHALGPRASRPLIKLNCAALPENLLESELFGHARGAFSGADADKAGLLEEADGGTIFLDEIGEMSPNLQAKLLRVLEDGRVRRVGATREREVDVRVVAATHRDLKELTESGAFRRDLYYRLTAMVLRVPPLRDRPRDIPLLAQRFVTDAGGRDGGATLSAAAMAALQRYSWPGNIRELRNAIGAARMMCDGDEIEPSHLPVEVAREAENPAPEPARAEMTGRVQVPPNTPLEEELRAIERQRIVEALERTGGNQTRAAELLGMPRRTLVYKLSSLGIKKPKPSRARKK